MNEQYAGSKFTTIVATGKNPQSNQRTRKLPKAMKRFMIFLLKEIFTEAIAQKKVADSIYGNNLWTPQLLYIEVRLLYQAKTG